MKTINLKSLIEIYDKNGGINVPLTYMNYLGSRIKDSELDPLKALIAILESSDTTLTLKDFNSFYIGYEIPQINKEFDLLRISESIVLNIEYKRQFTAKIKKQLLRNNYYLKFLNREMKLFTYVEKENKLYKLDKNNELIQADYQELIEIIKNQRKNDENFFEDNLNHLFKPSNYLISPFGKTAEFINGEYFLTKEQEEVERDLINETKNGGKHFLITGQAGSGKTLLTYHLARVYREAGFEVGLIHVGNLNDGHKSLNEQFEWNIQPIKYWVNLFSSNSLAVLIIDEIQRMNNKAQFEQIIKKVAENNTILIMSGDKRQTLANNEGWAIDLDNVKKFNLNNRIRTNKELRDFITVMLDLSRRHHIKVSNQNIDIVYFDKILEAKHYILAKKDYNYISYTPNTGNYSPLCKAHSLNFSQTGTSHQVIGQEFENVIAVLDEHFYYEENNLKASRITHNPYSVQKMFFQQITRAINKLEIVVVNNIDVFNKLIEIFER